MPADYRLHSLEDFLTSSMVNVDAQIDDGDNGSFPVKGREIEATVLFADISSFSTRTLGMTPVETLIFVNNFFTWMSAEALRGRPGIVDKYIGDEIMVIYSREFGSSDPLEDALQAAVAMVNNDVLNYRPHIGIASGPVVVGYVGTPMRYSTSVFGAPVALAARCAGVRPTKETLEEHQWINGSIVVPAAELAGRAVAGTRPAGVAKSRLRDLDVFGPRSADLKGIGEVEVVEILKLGFSNFSPEDRARSTMRFITDNNRYWPSTP